MKKYESVADETVSILRGWRRLTIRNGNKIPVFDFDVAPEAEAEHSNTMGEVYRRLYALRDKIEPQNELDGEFVEAELDSHLFFIPRQKKVTRIPLNEYIRGTLGVELEEFSRSEIDKKIAQIDELLRQRGFSYSKKGLMELRIMELITDPDEILALAQYEASLAKEAISTHADIPPYDEIIRFHDQHHSGYAGMDKLGRFVMELTDDPNTPEYHGGLVLHEETHFSQAALKKALIAGGRISKAAGVTTTHSQWNIQAEGLAYTSEQLYLPKRPWRFQIEALGLELRAMVYYNAHIVANRRLHEEGMTIKEAVEATAEDVRADLPAEPEGRLLWNIEVRLKNPTFRANFFTHGTAVRIFRPLVKMENEEKQSEGIRYQYEHPLTARQVREAIGE
jgi:hypothetical protein